MRKPTVTAERTCSFCGIVYSRKPEQGVKWFNRSRFCSKHCRYAELRQGGEKHNVWKPRPVLTCIQCGNSFSPKELSAKTRRQKICSQECLLVYKKARVGARHPGWRGGTVQKKVGYWARHQGANKWKFLHREIAERALGRPLNPKEVVHHINGDVLDNRNCNLLICSQSYHMVLHRRMKKGSTRF